MFKEGCPNACKQLMQAFNGNSFKKSLLLRRMSFVIDLVLLAGTNSVLVI